MQRPNNIFGGGTPNQTSYSNNNQYAPAGFQSN